MTSQQLKTDAFNLFSRYSIDYVLFSVVLFICVGIGVYTTHNEVVQAQNRDGINYEIEQGKVVVTEVRENSPAWLAGIRIDSIIISIDNEPVHSADQYLNLLTSKNRNLVFVIENHGALSSHIVNKGMKPELLMMLKITIISTLLLMLAYISIPNKGNPRTTRNTLITYLFLSMGLEYSLLPLRFIDVFTHEVPLWITYPNTILCAIVGGLTLGFQLHILCITPKPQAWFTNRKKLILSTIYSLAIFCMVVLLLSYFRFEIKGVYNYLVSLYAWVMVDIIWVILILLILFIQYISTSSRRGKNLIIILFSGLIPYIASVLFLDFTFVADIEEQAWQEPLEIFASFSIAISFLIVIKRYDLADIGRDIQRPLVFKAISALFIIFILENIYEQYLTKENINLTNSLFFAIGSFFIGMLWIPIAHLLQYWASHSWHNDADSNQKELHKVLDNTLTYSNNHRIAENLPRLLSACINTDWVAISIYNNNDKPFFYFIQNSDKLVNENEIENELTLSLYGNQKDYTVAPTSSDSSLFDKGGTLVLPLTYRENIYGGIALAQSVDEHLITRKSLSIFADELAEIVFLNQMRQLAIIDGLTNILRREAIMEKLYVEFVRYLKTSKEISICLVDLDHFKNINDQYGHAAGDLVLREIANLLDQNIRNTDFIGRYGGEEFLIVLPDTIDTDAKILLDSLRQTIEQNEFRISDDKSIKIEASFGLASTKNLINNDNNNPYHIIQKLVEEADIALYLAKQMGRNRVILAPSTQLH